MLQIMLLFEFAKVYSGIGSVFNHRQQKQDQSSNQSSKMEIFKQKMIAQKRSDIIELQTRTKVQSAANMSRKDVIKRIE